VQSAGEQYSAQHQEPIRTRPTPYVPPPRILRVGRSVETVAISIDGTRLATSAMPLRLVRVWNLQTGAAVCQLRPGGAVTALAFSPYGTKLATGSNDNTARIWDATTGERQLRVDHGGVPGNGVICALAFSPDGTRLATGSDDNTARIWDATTGEQQLQVTHGRVTGLVAIYTPGGTVNAVAFSPDGTRLATGSKDDTARIWDATTGEQRLQLTHRRTVTAVTFSPDGTKLATRSNDKTARIWDIADA
jgi:WD40 repeat protein